VLTWKLGGYIDDHSGETGEPRRRGFFEIAPGRLSVAGELSRPATADPWLLSQLISELIAFFQVRPHSLHLSFQLRRNQIDNQRVLPLGYAKCLLALGGGPHGGPAGLSISRMENDEIIQHTSGEELVFARTSRRNWYLGADEAGDRPPAQATTHVQQYKFIRLEEHINYEPLILGLKGLQLAYNPGDYLRAEQIQQDPGLARNYEELKEWAAHATPIGSHTIERFVDTVRQGLLYEGHRQPKHKLHYIEWALSSLQNQLLVFNQQADQVSGATPANH
jgi:hypothetical protein